LTFDRARASAIGIAIAALGDEVFEAIDRADPGWPVFMETCKLEPPFGLLAGMALALCDYQPGPGGSDGYCAYALAELRRRPAISSPTMLRDFMHDVLRHPPAARFNSAKRARADRLITSSISPWLGTRTIREVGDQPMELWQRLSTTMNQPMHAKTIAAAMKVFDLMHKIETGTYVSFRARVPILVDLRIARVSLASGLMGRFEAPALERLMVNGQQYAAFEGAAIRAAWAAASEYARGLSLFRIDGLVWQIGDVLHAHRHRTDVAAAGVATVLRKLGAVEPNANQVAAELTYGLQR
jgi:N-glycosylase/DNA lyase